MTLKSINFVNFNLILLIFSRINPFQIHQQINQSIQSVVKKTNIICLRYPRQPIDLQKRITESFNHPTPNHHQQEMNLGVNFQEGEFFKFPVSSDGLEWFSSVAQIRQAFAKQFAKLYGQNKKIKWFMVIVSRHGSLSGSAKAYSRIHKIKIHELWRISCKICSNQIIYGRVEGNPGYTLVSINYYHLHSENPGRYLKFLTNNANFISHMHSFADDSAQLQKWQSTKQDEPKLIHFFNTLTTQLKVKTTSAIMTKSFGLSQSQFDNLVQKINQPYQHQFEELVNKLNENRMTYYYLPQDLLPNSPGGRDTLTEEDLRRPQYQKDRQNPQLPNIIIITSPAMKDQYRKFGDVVGFDLTFSVVKERTAQNGQYMLGVFASTNLFKRIVTFALVVTNSQSTFAYYYIFKKFFELMGSAPPVIITDQQKCMHHALKKLQQEGIFHGHHLFDMFHILRKFRHCSCQSSTFYYIRKMMHAKDRPQYRKLLNLAKSQIVNDKEVKTLRAFDLNSQNYCYSQINPNYVGIGISNSTNEYFHSLIKSDIPYSVKFTRAVQLTLDLMERRVIFSQQPVSLKPFIQRLNLQFLYELKGSISDKAFEYILKQVGWSCRLKFISVEQQIKQNLQEPRDYKSRNCYFIKDEKQIYLIEKTFSQGLKNKNANQYSKAHKWRCLCGLSERTGYFCSHLFKVLLLQGEKLLNYISRRWFVNKKQVQKIALMKEISFLKMNKSVQRKIFFNQQNKISTRVETFFNGQGKMMKKILQ